ncbi:MAG TPA: hypothetical protein VMR76_01305 [Candidatus Saccharimonadia bacterium]|nr:hypothetical protein [Candidatus Saccharimonadia bacterium]
MELKTTNFKLTDDIITLSDVNNLEIELSNIEDFFLKVKSKTSLTQLTIPKSSIMLDELAKLNEINLIDKQDREQLKLFLQFIRTKSSVVHMSFNSIPDRSFLGALIKWLRTEAGMAVLILIGLQPNIGAGFKLRTTNKFFDFSLSQHLIAKKQLLIDELQKALTK